MWYDYTLQCSLQLFCCVYWKIFSNLHGFSLTALPWVAQKYVLFFMHNGIVHLLRMMITIKSIHTSTSTHPPRNTSDAHWEIHYGVLMIESLIAFRHRETRLPEALKSATWTITHWIKCNMWSFRNRGWDLINTYTNCKRTQNKCQGSNNVKTTKYQNQIFDNRD